VHIAVWPFPASLTQLEKEKENNAFTLCERAAETV
jgi:hypothetical protein